MRKIAKSAVVTALASAALAFGATSATADTGVDGFTIIHGDAKTQVHHCIVAGGDIYGNEAVICVDINSSIWWDPQNGGQYWGTGQAQTEAMCERNNVLEACESIAVRGEYATPLENQTYGSGCGTSIGDAPCGSGRLYGYSKTFATSPNYNCGSAPDSNADVWSLAVQPGTIWQLPSGAFVTLGSNYSTGHYYVCY